MPESQRHVDGTEAVLWFHLMSDFHVCSSGRILSSVSSYSLSQQIFDFSVQVASLVVSPFAGQGTRAKDVREAG